MDARLASVDSTSIPLLALREAIGVAGSQVALAAICRVTQPAVSKWLAKGEAPIEHVPAIEAGTGVSRHRLRPDFFGDTPAISNVNDGELEGVRR